MGIKGIIKRDCICPGCKHKFSHFFICREMNGINIFCPGCNNILWVPIDPRKEIIIFQKSKKERRKYYKTAEAVL